ncbi:MAG TPA: 50S ribosomal protein L6 [Patescibacteria group bacterium]|nr:50S ribosomal protein L6 [Patescibacteria group bacterium]
MSRIGKMPVFIPKDVQLTLESHKVVVAGPKGQLTLHVRPEVTIERKDEAVIIKRIKEDKFSKSYHGLIRSLIANMMKGVTTGWTKSLQLVGVGYRAKLEGKSVVLSVGFSHTVTIVPPEGVVLVVEENKIVVSGADKELVGRVAAQIRAVRPPDAYKGKGIRYDNEIVRTKPGKAGKGTAGGTQA